MKTLVARSVQFLTDGLIAGSLLAVLAAIYFWDRESINSAPGANENNLFASNVPADNDPSDLTSTFSPATPRATPTERAGALLTENAPDGSISPAVTLAPMEKPTERVPGEPGSHGILVMAPIRSTENVVDQLLTGSSLNKFGNPEGDDLGLTSRREFEGARILFWSFEPQVHDLIFTRDNPLWTVIRDKGFLLREERGRFQPRWLNEIDQLWIFASEQSGMDDQAEEAILAYVRGGKGLYLACDNAPFFVESNRLVEQLYFTQISGDYPGEQLIAVRGHGVTRDDFQRSLSGKRAAFTPKDASTLVNVINRATCYAEEHPLLTDVNFIYEGRTISHITPVRGLQPVLNASDGQLLAAVATDPGQRVIVDCGYTRYGYSADKKFIVETAGTLRYAENIAAYLMGKENRYSNWHKWRVRHELVKKYRDGNSDEVFVGLRNTSTDERWAAALVADRRRMDIPEALVVALHDPSRDVQQIVRQALKQLADGADFGPVVDATEQECALAFQGWDEWLRQLKLADQYAGLTETDILAHMTSAVDVERLAAVRAARKRKLQIPDALIVCLTDEQSEVRHEAHRALTSIANGADFGPQEGATLDEQNAAVVDWKRWRLPSKFPLFANVGEDVVAQALESAEEDERWAALVAIGNRNLRLIEPIVSRLGDSQTLIQQEARRILVRLTKEDFGPTSGSNSQDVAAAQRKWLSWWKADREKAAGQSLRLAKAVFKKNPGAARRRLQQVVSQHSGTDAAAEAEELLRRIP